MKNRLKKPNDANVIQKNFAYSDCTANFNKVLISFEYITDQPEFNLGALSNGNDDAHLMRSAITALRIITSNNWDTLLKAGKHNGFEWFSLSEFEKNFVSALKHVTPEEKVYIYRFNGNKSRLIFRRGRQCRRVAQLLGCERKLGEAYDHGN